MWTKEFLGWRERDQQDARCLLSNFYLNMFDNKFDNKHQISWNLLVSLSLHPTFMMHGHKNLKFANAKQAQEIFKFKTLKRTPYAAVHTLVLLMMGIIMPETCWDKSLIINIRLVASGWSLSLSLHPTFMMHGHKSLKEGVLVFYGAPQQSQDIYMRKKTHQPIQSATPSEYQFGVTATYNAESPSGYPKFRLPTFPSH